MSGQDSTPLLTYFDIRGRAEVIRLILEEAAAPYRERRVQEREWAALKPTLPLERLLAENEGGRGFWVGRGLTYVDFCAWHFLDYVRPFSQLTLERFQLLHAFKQRITARPRIAAYLASERRPRTLTVSMAPFGGTPETS